MKVKALQLGKAMSAALFVLLLSVAGMKNALAQIQVATLQHNDSISAFYGTNAFVQAHTAAQTGDIITLSSGTFVPTTITKAITLRGAGCAVDTVANTNPTIFGGNIVLNVTDNANFLTIEGILFSNKVDYQTLYNPKFNRCNFTEIDYYGSYYMSNAEFVNCIINLFDFSHADNTVLINSVVWQPCYITNSHTVVLYNSIFKMCNGPYYDGISGFNSIFIRSYSYSPSSYCSFINCIGIDTYSSSNPYPFGNAYTSGCATYTSYDSVFESFTGTFSFDEPFILKNEIATGFLGGDGTQVGIHGGIMPYTNIPSYMLRTNVSVPNHSNLDGTLNVEIEIIDEGE